MMNYRAQKPLFSCSFWGQGALVGKRKGWSDRDTKMVEGRRGVERAQAPVLPLFVRAIPPIAFPFDCRGIKVLVALAS